MSPERPDPTADLKAKQSATWGSGNFDMVASLLTVHAVSPLVRFAGIQPGQRVLDIATGTGVVALAAQRMGGKVTGIDFAPELIDLAKRNARWAEVPAVFQVADAENLPFPDASFDVVLSQFGHMFTPRPEAVCAEMLRVLAPGGRIAFSTWPPESIPGRLFQITGKYVPSPPGVPPPALWGERGTVTERLGTRVKDLEFAPREFYLRMMSPRHYVEFFRTNFGPTLRAFQALSGDPKKAQAFEQDLMALVSEGMDESGVNVRHEYLLTRARKT